MSDSTANLRITLNGQPRQVRPRTTVADLVRESRLREDQVAVEVNRRLVRSAEYGREVADGDVVELVTFVGGG